MENELFLLKLRNTVDDAKRIHADLAYSLGTYFGYPECCKVEFCEDILKDIDPSNKNINGSGFIPCRKHFVQIQLGELKLEDLIKNRVCSISLNENIWDKNNTIKDDKQI